MKQKTFRCRRDRNEGIIDAGDTMKKLKSIAMVLSIALICLASFENVEAIRVSDTDTNCIEDKVCRENAEKGQEHFKSEDYQKAIEYFLKTLEYDSDYVRGMTYLAISYCKINEMDLAENYLNKVIMVDPDSEEASIAKDWLPACSVVVPEPTQDNDGDNETHKGNGNEMPENPINVKWMGRLA